MPDPHKDLAPIIEPVAPPAVAADAGWLVPGLAILAVLLLALIAAWLWRRRAPLRSLRRLRNHPDPVAAAQHLSALIVGRQLQADLRWLQDLQRLRFGAPATDAAATFARLCREAEVFLRQK